jgi:chromosomal replication initiator protein
MDTESTKQWAACLQAIKANVPEKEFSTWFAPLSLHAFTAGRLTIVVPNAYVGEYIREHYSKQLLEAVTLTFGKATNIFFLDAERLADQKRAEEGAKSKTPQKSTLNPNLNSNYSFSNFVVGESNKLAAAVAQSIVDKPGKSTFNPLFIYGPSGVGKTHLVNATGLAIAQRYPEKRVLFVSAHVFRTQYTDSVIHNKSNEFLNFYQSIDVLIIDDIQEITTAKTQQAFFHIFNHLQQTQRQLIITCDRPPVLFEGIEERMLTRFKWGMVAEIEKPDTKLRKAILETKIRRDGLSFPDDVVQYIAQHAESSVRELEGIVNGIMAYSIFDNCDIDLQLASRVVARIVNMEKRELTGSDIISAVCQHYGTRQRDVVSKSRKQAIVQARQLAMYLCHKYTDMSYCQIGRDLGNRDHSTVIHSCDQVSRRMSVDRTFRHEVEELESVLKKK